jgi:hypothetical protein
MITIMYCFILTSSAFSIVNVMTQIHLFFTSHMIQYNIVVWYVHSFQLYSINPTYYIAVHIVATT